MPLLTCVGSVHVCEPWSLGPGCIPSLLNRDNRKGMGPLENNQVFRCHSVLTRDGKGTSERSNTGITSQKVLVQGLPPGNWGWSCALHVGVLTTGWAWSYADLWGANAFKQMGRVMCALRKPISGRFLFFPLTWRPVQSVGNQVHSYYNSSWKWWLILVNSAMSAEGPSKFSELLLCGLWGHFVQKYVLICINQSTKHNPVKCIRPSVSSQVIKFTWRTTNATCPCSGKWWMTADLCICSLEWTLTALVIRKYDSKPLDGTQVLNKKTWASWDFSMVWKKGYGFQVAL